MASPAPSVPLDINDEFSIRTDKVRRLRALGVNPYAARFAKKHPVAALMARKQDAGLRPFPEAKAAPVAKFSTAGRLVALRDMGKLAFGRLQDATGTVQVAFSAESLKVAAGGKALAEFTGEDGAPLAAYKVFQKLFDIADFVGVTGELAITNTGELTLVAAELTMLSKALRPLPEKFHGLTDAETIYRKRYLDLTSNEESYQRFVTRSKFIAEMRNFYAKNGFTEIETPVLGNSASGAAAKPFVTRHEDLGIDVFLHISPETSLKKATAGRFERVFEIARDFRNEGSDPSHMQEFTMVEHYAAWWDYRDNMKFAEKMVKTLMKKAGIPLKVTIKDKEGVAREVDFGAKWERIDYGKRIKEVTGIDVTKFREGDDAKMRAALLAKGIHIDDADRLGLTTLVDKLYKKLVRPKIAGPAFIFNYPKFMQPLARVSDKNPNVVEQFQVLVNGWEIVKAYSELVDAVDQRERFAQQAKAAAAGDEEATAADYDFVEAMEHGMPCQSGLGLGIDRFLALTLGQDNLRDVVMFPLTRPAGAQGPASQVQEALAAESGREIVSRRRFSFPRNLMLEAWTNPENIQRWWGPDGFSNEFRTFEPRAGGTWDFTMVGPDGKRYENLSKFVEASQDRIVLDHVVDPKFRMTATLQADGEGTVLTLRMTFEDARVRDAVAPVVVPSNEQLFGRLETVLSRMAKK